MNQNIYVKTIIQYMEDHMNEENILDDICRRFYVSLRQLYRIFYSYTGHPIKEYIRKRRISNACALIKYGDIPLVDIALHSGYQTQQAFQKYFKQMTGFTPLQYKNNDCIFFFEPLHRQYIKYAVQISDTYIPNRNVYPYYHSNLNGIENRALQAYADKIEQGRRVFGRNGQQLRNRFCYNLMIEDEQNAVMESYNQLFATCAVGYHDNDINDAWDYLYHIWLPRSIFELSDMDFFEEYHFCHGVPNKLTLYIPIRKKAVYQMMRIHYEAAKSFLIAKKCGKNAKQASMECLTEFLRDRYPSLLYAGKFYICEYSDVCEYGVPVDYLVKLPQYADLYITQFPAGEYLRLYGGKTLHPDMCIEVLHEWLEQNNLYSANDRTFVIYEQANDDGGITMTINRKIKMAETDNTEQPSYTIMDMQINP